MIVRDHLIVIVVTFVHSDVLEPQEHVAYMSLAHVARLHMSTHKTTKYW